MIRDIREINDGDLVANHDDLLQTKDDLFNVIEQITTSEILTDEAKEQINSLGSSYEDKKEIVNSNITVVEEAQQNENVEYLQEKIIDMQSSIEKTEDSIQMSVGTVTELSDGLENITERVEKAEVSLSKDNITAIIGDYYTTSSDVNGIVDKKGYQTESQVKQTVDKLEVKFSESGGYNFFYNGDFKRGLEKWNNNGGVYETTLSCPSNQKGVKLAGEIGKTKSFSQSFSCDFIEPFTLSFWQYTGAGTDGTTNPRRVPKLTITYADGTKVYFAVPPQQKFDTWEKRSITIKPKQRLSRVLGTFYNRDTTRSIYYTNIMIEKGSIVNEFSHNPNEVYDGITSMDRDGIKVVQSNINGYTQMSADKFVMNKDGEDVFKVDSEGAYFKGRVNISGGTVSDDALSSSIKNGASAGTSAKSTLDSKANLWDSAKTTADAVNKTVNDNKANWNSAKTTADAVSKTVNDNKVNWTNAYNRVLQWAYGAITGNTNINGGLIETNTITANHIAVGDFTNYCLRAYDGYSTSGSAWYYIANSSKNHIHVTQKMQALKGGEQFRVEGRCFAPASNTANCTLNIAFTWRDADNNIISGGTQTYSLSMSANTSKAFSTVIIIPSRPANADYGRFKYYISDTTQTLHWRTPSIRLMNSAELIVDGSITATKLHADAINGKTITGSTIRGGTFFTAKDSTQTDGYAFRIYDDGRVFSKNTIMVYGKANNGIYSTLQDGKVTATEYMQSGGFKTSNSTMYWGINDANVSNPTGNNANRLEFTTISDNKYFRPGYNGTVRSGSTSYPWYNVYSKNGVSTTSDRNAKENIQYLNRSSYQKTSPFISNADMFKFIKDDYLMAQYNYIGDDEIKVSAIAQDLLVDEEGNENKIGNLIVNNQEALEERKEGENSLLTINQTQLLNVTIGALQETMQKVEELENRIIELEKRTLWSRAKKCLCSFFNTKNGI
nr:MAG: chaperone of endosialidase [Bacteriophage sp.]